MDLTLVVMAAGLGSRYGGLKQLDKIGPSGEILLEYSVFDAVQAGFNKVVFVVQENTEGIFRDFINERISSRADLSYVQQSIDASHPKGCLVDPNRKKPWGTGHAVLVAKDHISGPFAVINADDYYGPNAFNLLADFFKTPNPLESPQYCLVGYPLKRTLSSFGAVSRGICKVDEDNSLSMIEERPCVERNKDGVILEFRDDGRIISLTGSETVSMNAWGFTPDFFRFLETKFSKFIHEHGNDPKREFCLPEVVNDCVQEGRAVVKVLPVDESWFGMTHKADRNKVVTEICKRVELGIYPKKLWGKGC